MAVYADWINLMSYDLHGIWDSKNPIGNQVLAHTNLTEIDLALDLVSLMYLLSLMMAFINHCADGDVTTHSFGEQR